jgi:hypothetical protein
MFFERKAIFVTLKITVLNSCLKAVSTDESYLYVILILNWQFFRMQTIKNNENLGIMLL